MLARTHSPSLRTTKQVSSVKGVSGASRAGSRASSPSSAPSSSRGRSSMRTLARLTAAGRGRDRDQPGLARPQLAFRLAHSLVGGDELLLRLQPSYSRWASSTALSRISSLSSRWRSSMRCSAPRLIPPQRASLLRRSAVRAWSIRGQAAGPPGAHARPILSGFRSDLPTLRRGRLCHCWSPQPALQAPAVSCVSSRCGG
jgi:hypothetical protein